MLMRKHLEYNIHTIDYLTHQPCMVGAYAGLRAYDAYLQNYPHAEDTMRKYFAKTLYAYRTEIEDYDTVICDGLCKETLKGVLRDSVGNLPKYLDIALMDKLESLYESDVAGAQLQRLRD